MRNSQASVLAPTGTIGLMMDCDTTGIEPDLGLVKMKKLVGGGTMTIVNQTIPRALRKLGYTPQQIDDIVAYIDTEKSILGAPHLSAEHVPVFACSMGDNTIHYEGHVRMMGAVQPFISGAISKTVNMPEEATDRRHRGAAPAVVGARPEGRRDLPRQLQGGQPLSTAKKGDLTDDRPRKPPPRPQPPRWSSASSRRSSTSPSARSCRAAVVAARSSSAWPTARASRPSASTQNGQPGEIFLTVSKQGSTLSGIMDAFAKSISYGLQYGVPLRAFVEAFTNMRFEPAGMTDDPDIRFASSIMDYLFRRLALEYLTYDERAELGIFSIDERLQPTLPGVEESVMETRTGHRDGGRPEDHPVGRRARPAARVGHGAPCAEQRHHQPAGCAPRRRDHAQAGSAPQRCTDVHAVRRADEPRRLLPRLPQLRQHQRLQLM